MSTESVRAAADLLRKYRTMVKAAEKDLARNVRADIAAGVSVTEIAKAAGISRERVYQIRDGRR